MIRNRNAYSKTSKSSNTNYHYHSSSCASGHIEAEVQVMTDKYPSDTSWVIRNKHNGIAKKRKTFTGKHNFYKDKV